LNNRLKRDVEDGIVDLDYRTFKEIKRNLRSDRYKSQLSLVGSY